MLGIRGLFYEWNQAHASLILFSEVYSRLHVCKQKKHMKNENFSVLRNKAYMQTTARLLYIMRGLTSHPSHRLDNYTKKSYIVCTKDRRLMCRYLHSESNIRCETYSYHSHSSITSLSVGKINSFVVDTVTPVFTNNLTSNLRHYIIFRQYTHWENVIVKFHRNTSVKLGQRDISGRFRLFLGKINTVNV